MPIPLEVKLDPRAKVRVGVRQRRGDKEYPAAVDYFVCEDPELEELFGKQPSKIPVQLAFATADEAFPTGLEWWGKRTGNKATLVCYSKGNPPEKPVARRLSEKVDEGDERRGPDSNKRTPITCGFRECSHFKSKECRPMGRLDFYLVGGRQDAPLRFETKSFHSIERMLGVLRQAERLGDLTELTFELSVAFESEGDKRFPVVEIKLLGGGGTRGNATPGAGAMTPSAEELTPRQRLYQLIAARGENPRDERIVAWVKRIGVEAALAALEGDGGSGTSG